MNVSVVAHESLARDSRVVPPRVGGGVGGRGRAIHASHLTSANPSSELPVDNANAAVTQHRLGWMDLRWIGGGW